MTTQKQRNDALLAATKYMRDEVTSSVLPFQLDATADALSAEQIAQFKALGIETARTAISSVGTLSKLGEVDHLGGGLDLIPALLMTLAFTDYEKVDFTIENAHTSIGYYSSLATLGFVDPADVINQFRQGLDIPGHVSWVPGGTQLNGGRLGVMIPAAVGQALGKKAIYGDEGLVICHCGDAGWISGQALNGFNAADLHDAPVIFIMHRNGIQLSGSNKDIMDKDPRPIIESLGITIIETPTIHDPSGLFEAYKKAIALAKQGRPSMIFPVGTTTTLQAFAEENGIVDQTKAFADAQGVAMDKDVWIPGALMSYGDLIPMLECIFLVNDLPGGKGHHDGHLKGRDLDEILANPLLQMGAEEKDALEALRSAGARTVVTKARPAPGSKNLEIPAEELKAVELAGVGKSTSARGGTQAAYAAVAKANPESLFIVGCDLDPSTKMDKARTFIAENRQFEMSIEEQVSAIMANGLAVATHDPQLVVFSTFSAFFAGIAREGFDMWRYQRNLNGINEGLNVTFHLSHVGACTGRDHFSGWDLDWVNLALAYLPYIHRFYAPADIRSAYIAVKDLAANYGGHIIGIPRDNLPVLSKQDSDQPLWEATDEWEALTVARKYDGAKKAILALGAPAFIAIEAAEKLSAEGTPCDAIVINGLPLPEGTLNNLFAQYSDGLVTVEDGIIATRETGLQGFAGMVDSAAYGHDIALAHVGIEDPRIAPSEGHMEVWEHFGITTAALVDAANNL